MNKAIFLKTLKKQLKKLNPSEIRKNISYYDEIISDMVENGLTEEEALLKIGSPRQIAREILENTAPENFRRKDIIGRVLIAASAVAVILSIMRTVLTHVIFNTAVSIIGGADGPTSVFIAGKIGWPRPYGIAAILVTVTIVYLLIKHRTAHK